MTPRMRVLAGPNGSGKSTLAKQLATDYAVNLYTFLNADVLYAEIRNRGKTACPFSIAPDDLTAFVESSTYPDEYKRDFYSKAIFVDDEDYIVFAPESINSYTVAMVADFLKEQYLLRKISFSFETVFSHPAKIDILKRARERGYRTYLYFIATDSPDINVARIHERVQLGGHDVPEDKTRQRYIRCLEQIKAALPYLNRAYFFDNTTRPVLFAEFNQESGLSFQTQDLPYWFLHFVLNA